MRRPDRVNSLGSRPVNLVPRGSGPQQPRSARFVDFDFSDLVLNAAQQRQQQVQSKVDSVAIEIIGEDAPVVHVADEVVVPVEDIVNTPLAVYYRYK